MDLGNSSPTMYEIYKDFNILRSIEDPVQMREMGYDFLVKLNSCQVKHPILADIKLCVNRLIEMTFLDEGARETFLFIIIREFVRSRRCKGCGSYMHG